MRKMMKLIFVLICLLGLMGCDPGTNTIDAEELLGNTVKIELYYYENTNPKLVNLNGKKEPVFDFSKATFLAALDESRFEDVIQDIAEQECFVYGKVLNEPIGKTMILYQDNGNMVVLFSCIYKQNWKLTRYFGECSVFDENGVFIEYIGRTGSEYVDMVEATCFGSGT